MRRAALLLALAGTAAAALPAFGHSGHDRNPRATKFELPVIATPELGSGYSPTVAVDRWGNVVVGARKDTPVGVGDDGVPQLRSWTRLSIDEGDSFQALPSTLGASSVLPGLGGGADFDAVGRLYVLDAHGPTSTLTRYDVKGRGRFTQDFEATNATGGPATNSEVVAWGDGRVATMAITRPDLPFDVRPEDLGAPLSAAAPDTGVVSVAVYGGKELELLSSGALDGVTDCRAAADPRPAGRTLWLGCLDGEGQVLALVSAQGTGEDWQRQVIGSYDVADTTIEPPAVTVGFDGTLHALQVAGQQVVNGVPTSNRLLLHSARPGKPFRARDVTDAPGRYHHASLAASPDGRLGYAYYQRRTPTTKWNLNAGISKTTARTFYGSDFAHEQVIAAPGAARTFPDRISATFSRDGRLHLVWTVPTETTAATNTPVQRQVVHARSFPQPQR